MGTRKAGTQHGMHSIVQPFNLNVVVVALCEWSLAVDERACGRGDGAKQANLFVKVDRNQWTYWLIWSIHRSGEFTSALRRRAASNSWVRW